MESIESFKVFVKQHPELVSYVNEGNMSWQKFYEQWSLYGETSPVWEKYFKKQEEAKNTSTDNFNLGDIFKMVKNINFDNLQKNITSIQKGIGLIQDLTSKKVTEGNDVYTPSPMYKHFED